MKFPKMVYGLLALGFAAVSSAEPVPVTASFSILGDVAREIGAERVQVSEIIGADEDAHAYRMTPQDVRQIRSAKLVLMNGLGFEPTEFDRAVRAAKVQFAYAAQGIEARKNDDDGHDEHGHDEHDGHDHHGEHGHHDYHDHGEYDPHVWLDPVLMKTYAENVADALSQADPAGKEHYQARLKDYQKKLDELHHWAQIQLDGVPPAARKILTAHDAFGYFGARYQIEFIAPQGISSESEPSARGLAEVIRQVKRDNIRVIFAENIKNPRMIDRLTRETGVKLSGKLYSDALSAADAPTYLQMMRFNIDAVSRALKAQP